MIFGSPIPYFTDAVLRAPTIGSILMCVAASLVGVIVFLRKQSLLGESLSHASYPGVILGILCAASWPLDDSHETGITLFIIGGAFTSALMGLGMIRYLERQHRVSADSALCFVLASFFGVGLTLASRVQVTHTALYRQIQAYLYGQAATMTDWHIVIYGLLAAGISVVIISLYKELQIINFDRDYAESLGVKAYLVEPIFFFLVVLSVIIGIRCVGVVLMSAMLIAPAVAARQFTHRLSLIFILAGCFGALSGFFGNYLSVELSHYLSQRYGEKQLTLPTGPSIVLCSTAFCVFSLLFARERGLVLRWGRMLTFRLRCMQENLLKAMWRTDSEACFLDKELREFLPGSQLLFRWVIRRLCRQGWLMKELGGYRLTADGKLRAAYIVRLHRLWEVYLVSEVGVARHRVHASAEEVEHILTPELEARLTKVLMDPKLDPHNQPIPHVAPQLHPPDELR